jgi:hypothetical protein
MNVISHALLFASISLVACHQINSAQWTSNPNQPIDSARIIRLVRAQGIHHQLVDCTDEKKFPNTLILMREIPIGEQTVDLGVRQSGSSVMIDVWAGYGVTNPKFSQIKSDVHQMLKFEFPGAFLESKDPIRP